MMSIAKEKKRWERLAETDPYFSVATFDQFLGSNLDESAQTDFFRTGAEYVDNLWRDLEILIGHEPRPARALDFGCGVGRVLAPLAQKCGSVVGVDISEQMLAEAKKNCGFRDISNVEFIVADRFDAAKESFDFIHSFIVLQHIEPRLGLSLARSMIASLGPGGVGMLHFTYVDPSTAHKRLKSFIYGKLGPLRSSINKIRGRADTPWMPMHAYNLNEIFRLLQEEGCQNVSVRFTHHGLFGAMVFFEKAGELKY